MLHGSLIRHKFKKSIPSQSSVYYLSSQEDSLIEIIKNLRIFNDNFWSDASFPGSEYNFIKDDLCQIILVGTKFTYFSSQEVLTTLKRDLKRALIKDHYASN